MKKNWLWILIIVILILAGITFYMNFIKQNITTISNPKNISISPENISKTPVEPNFSQWTTDFKSDICHKNTVNLSFTKCTYRGYQVYPLDYRYEGNSCPDAYEEPVYYENGTVLCSLSGGFAADSGRETCPNFDQEKVCEPNFIVRIP